ncbi:7553_t:CDS:2 [Ambispora leptoticha]|uniref:7553_t:CDS:1 n=1 Tax=Ambispora leptoticha TaxID=144679 RepID=A0A9N9GAS4_9GLOM|nr:7553_t:CDS:2 [Ambispora leptoticha]
MDVNNVSSLYAATQGVPLILAPQFSSLKPISLPHDFDLFGDLPPMPQPCDFELERSVISQLERERQAATLKLATRAEKIRTLHEERIRKQKAEARKIAPGFLDTDRRILTPEPEKLSAVATNTTNPWDLSSTIEDDLNETMGAPFNVVENLNPTNGLKQHHVQTHHNIHQQIIQHTVTSPINDPILEIRQSHQQQEASQPLLHQGGYPTTSNYNPQNTTTTNSPFPITSNNALRTMSSPSSPSSSLQLYSPAQYLTTSITPTTTGTGSFSRGRSASYTAVIPPNRPPKEELPRSRSTTPSPSRISTASPEINKDSEVLKQLVNMGFSREQAIDALEKYDNDLVKATNYLLDN